MKKYFIILYRVTGAFAWGFSNVLYSSDEELSSYLKEKYPEYCPGGKRERAIFLHQILELGDTDDRGEVKQINRTEEFVKKSFPEMQGKQGKLVY